MPVLFIVAGGTAFRLNLPTLRPVNEGFDSCDINVAYVADSHTHLLATNEPLCQHLLGPYQLLGGFQSDRIVVGEVLYLLSGLRQAKKATVTKKIIKAERWQLAPRNSARRASFPSASLALSVGQLARQEEAQSQKRWGDPAAFAIRSWAPPSQGYGPLSSRTSKDPNIVANFPQYCTDDSGGEEKYDDLTVEQELPLNVALAKPINFTRYVDYLPQGDLFAPSAKLIDKRLAINPLWCVKQDLATYFKSTRIEPGLRMQAWQLLTAPHRGVPCTITSDGLLKLTLAGMASSASFKSSLLKDGAAVLKLLPVGDDYACQPESAWPEASYLFNNWRIVVEQGGNREDLYQPLAASVGTGTAGHQRDTMLLDQLAEIASAERGPGHIVYGKVPYWDSAQFSGIGIRLRDGGARLHLDVSKAPFFVMPCNPHLHSKWGRFDGKNPEPRYDTTTLVYASFRVEVPKGPHDVILRVNESDNGDYKKLEYVLRPRESFKPIKFDEWLPVDKTLLDEWVICFFVNLAKVTWGCLNRDLIRPSPASSSPTVSPATSTVPSEPARSSASTSDAREKRPRLS